VVVNDKVQRRAPAPRLAAAQLAQHCLQLLDRTARHAIACIAVHKQTRQLLAHAPLALVAHVRRHRLVRKARASSLLGRRSRAQRVARQRV